MRALLCGGGLWSKRWAEAHEKIARMTLTIKLDRNWSSFQLANSAPPLSVTDSAIAPSARMLRFAADVQLALRFVGASLATSSGEIHGDGDFRGRGRGRGRRGRGPFPPWPLLCNSEGRCSGSGGTCNREGR